MELPLAQNFYIDFIKSSSCQVYNHLLTNYKGILKLLLKTCKQYLIKNKNRKYVYVKLYC